MLIKYIETPKIIYRSYTAFYCHTLFNIGIKYYIFTNYLLIFILAFVSILVYAHLEAATVQ